jgi:hypothetical protein
MLRCYDSKRQNQEGWSSLHAHFGGKRRRFITLNHKQKNLQSCRACDCAQKIFDLNKTAEDRLAFRLKEIYISIKMTREAPAAIEDRKKEIGITGDTMRAEFV